MSIRKTKWNTRYVAYARAQGREPADQQLHDRNDHVYGSGFLAWSCDRLSDAEREIPDAFQHGKLVDRSSYDAWLERWVDAQLDRTANATDLVS